MDLCARAQTNIQNYALIPPGASILIAVSGGVDSMVLLHLLRHLSLPQGWSLAIAHFNHCLRGAESDADEAFVRTQATLLNLPYYSASGDVRGTALDQGISIEMAARKLRHCFLGETAAANRLNYIALAHHADDQIETFWLRLLRGDVGPGLAGIRWKRPLSTGSSISLVRPLLNITKQELLAFAAEKQIPFREDQSNLDLTFLRNRMRHEVLPALKQFQPSLRTLTLRAAEVLGQEKFYIEAEAQRWLAHRDQSFPDLHPALQREVIRLQLIDLEVAPGFDLIEQLRISPDCPASISAEKQICRKQQGNVVFLEAPNLEFVGLQKQIHLESADHATLAEISFRWSFVSSRGPAAPGTEYFDADTIGSTVTLRFWTPGDKFYPSGLERETKLQDIFTNNRIPAEEKRKRILAVDQAGKVFWVEGLRISEPHKVVLGSKRILKWMWHRDTL